MLICEASLVCLRVRIDEADVLCSVISNGFPAWARRLVSQGVDGMSIRKDQSSVTLESADRIILKGLGDAGRCDVQVCQAPR